MFGRGKNRSEDNGRWKSGEKIKLVCLVEETKKKMDGKKWDGTY